MPSSVRRCRRAGHPGCPAVFSVAMHVPAMLMPRVPAVAAASSQQTPSCLPRSSRLAAHPGPWAAPVAAGTARRPSGCLHAPAAALPTPARGTARSHAGVAAAWWWWQARAPHRRPPGEQPVIAVPSGQHVGRGASAGGAVTSPGPQKWCRDAALADSRPTTPAQLQERPCAHVLACTMQVCAPAGRPPPDLELLRHMPTYNRPTQQRRPRAGHRRCQRSDHAQHQPACAACVAAGALPTASSTSSARCRAAGGGGWCRHKGRAGGDDPMAPGPAGLAVRRMSHRPARSGGSLLRISRLCTTC